MSSPLNQFSRLADQWERETRNLSSLNAITRHPIHAQIVGMGPSIVPLILKRMQNRPWFWFSALKQLARPGSDPAIPEIRGDLQKMTDAWLRWGADRGII